ncbi:MAG: proton-conducting transporter membrane subunit [Pseudonocardia sp.]
MTPALALLVACLVGTGCAVAAWMLPAGVRPRAAGTGVALVGGFGLAAGIAMLAGAPFAVSAPGLLPLAGLAFQADPLGALFVCVVSAVAVPVGIYTASYARSHGLDDRVPQAALPLFVLAMIAVPLASSVATLLVCWELTALTSLAVLVAEHRGRPEVASAARWYAVMTHLGFLALLVGLSVLAATAGDGGFAALRAAGQAASPAVASLVFVAAVVGFGSKAGLVPLHAWLPRAHAEAPSHLSALMSAAMVNLGVYGTVRVGFDLLGGGPAWWWLALLGLGALSAVYGILQAAISTDLKRLLGQSTTENMGLVLLGVGAAGLFTTAGRPQLAALALTAALLHLLGHAAFKTLLFLGAGSVLRATGTRDLDALGGLRPTMPATTGLFGVGALAASALPPGTAFVSEWLLLQALVHGPGGGQESTAITIAMPLAVAAVALTAGLSIATFVKAFGVGFLARPRSDAAAGATEAPPGMLAGMALAAVACAVLAWFPGLVLPAVAAAVAVAVPGTPAVTGVVSLQLADVMGVLSPALLAFALVAGTAVVVAAARMAGRGTRRAAREWECGGGPLTARMEYTATSFAEPLQRVFDDVLAPETSVDVDHYDESHYLVRSIAFRREVPDRIERRLYDPVLAAAREWGRRGRALADGSVHRYLGYGFVGLCALLAVLAVFG